MTNQSNEKSKNGKRLALILLALLLIAAIAFGAYTYSKYVTNQKGTGSATVAMWGYQIKIASTDTSEDDDFFATSYSSSSNQVIASVSDPQTDVVGPGASGSVTITVGGVSEVNAFIDFAIDITNDVKIAIKSSDKTLYYFPILFTMKEVIDDETANVVDDCADVPLEVLAATLNKENSINTEVIGVGKEISKTYTISWEWAFERTAGATLYEISNDAYTAVEDITLASTEVDKLDTVLGQIAYNNNSANSGNQIVASYSSVNYNGNGCTIDLEGATYSVEINFDITVSVEQTQNAA